VRIVGKISWVAVALLLTFCLCTPAWGATYNYYFSDDAAGNAAGDDTTGDGSEGTPWKTLSKAQSAINALDSSDTANLYFDRGDTWTVSTGQNIVFTVDNTDPIVNIDAYGAGDRPIFDGGISDFAAVDESGTNGYYFYRMVFLFERNNCSMKNIEIKRIYGPGIRLGSSSNTNNKADYFTLSDCYIHDIGYSGITVGTHTGASNCTVVNNTIHTAMELYRTEKVPWWSGAINFYAESFYPSNDNLIRYNVVYDIYGEGIQGNMGTIEYNVIGDTGSYGIYPVPSLYDAEDAIVRYNFIIQSSSATYKNHPGSSYQGIVYQDENSRAGDNSNATIKIYGNIIINRKAGIKLYNGDELGEIRIFNNTIIDSESGNLVVDDVDEFNAAYIYNNSSILYDKTSENHTVDYSGLLPHDNWTIDNNHFWTTGGSPTVDADWQTNYVTTDPKLLGEAVPVDWDGQSGATYFSDIDFDTHLYLASDSGLIDTGKTLESYNTLFLTNGTDFGDLPTTETFTSVHQADHPQSTNAWDIGAVIYRTTQEIPPVAGDNDFSQDTDCIGWWEFENNATDSKGDDDLTNEGTPTYEGGDDDAVILDGSSDALYLANLTGNVTADLTIYALFKFDAELTGDELQQIAGEWNDGAKCFSLMIRDSATGDEDRACLLIGSNSGADTNIATDSSVDLDHGTYYAVIATYDNTNDDTHIWIYSVNMSTRVATRVDTDDNEEVLAPDINNENSEFCVGANWAHAANWFDGNIYELAILTVEKDETAAAEMAGGTYGEPSICVIVFGGTTTTYFTAGTVVEVFLIWDREPFIEDGVPYFDTNIYDGTDYLRFYYVGKVSLDPEVTHWEAIATAGMRSHGGAKVKIDFKAGTTSITLPTDCTITDKGGSSATLSGLDSLDSSSNTYIEIAGTFTIGTGGVFPLWSDGSTGLHDILYDVDDDTFYVLAGGFTDDVVISADDVEMRGIGPTQPVTGALTFSGSNGLVTRATFSGTVTGGGADGNVYHPVIRRWAPH